MCNLRLGSKPSYSNFDVNAAVCIYVRRGRKWSHEVPDVISIELIAIASRELLVMDCRAIICNSVSPPHARLTLQSVSDMLPTFKQTPNYLRVGNRLISTVERPTLQNS